MTLDTLLNTEIDLDERGIGEVLKSLLLQGVVENCDNPSNRHGFLFDDDVDADCFSDLDMWSLVLRLLGFDGDILRNE